jgi:hypothetical protein
MRVSALIVNVCMIWRGSGCVGAVIARSWLLIVHSERLVEWFAGKIDGGKDAIRQLEAVSAIFGIDVEPNGFRHPVPVIDTGNLGLHRVGKVFTRENVGQNKSETFVDAGSVIAGNDALVVDTEQLRKSIVG